MLRWFQKVVGCEIGNLLRLSCNEKKQFQFDVFVWELETSIKLQRKEVVPIIDVKDRCFRSPMNRRAHKHTTKQPIRPNTGTRNRSNHGAIETQS